MTLFFLPIFHDFSMTRFFSMLFHDCGNPVFHVVQPHLPGSSSSSLPLHFTLQHLLEIYAVVVSGDVAIPQGLPFIYSLQDWLLGFFAGLVVGGLPCHS